MKNINHNLKPSLEGVCRADIIQIQQSEGYKKGPEQSEGPKGVATDIYDKL